MEEGVKCCWILCVCFGDFWDWVCKNLLA